MTTEDAFSPGFAGEDDDPGWGGATQGLRHGTQEYFDGDFPGNPHQEYQRGVMHRTAQGPIVYYPQQPQYQPQQQPIYQVVGPAPLLASRPGEEGLDASETLDSNEKRIGRGQHGGRRNGYGNGDGFFRERARDIWSTFRTGAPETRAQRRQRELRRSLREAKKTLRGQRGGLRKARRAYFRAREARRGDLGMEDRIRDVQEQSHDLEGDEYVWEQRALLAAKKEGVLSSGLSRENRMGYEWESEPSGAPLSTITFSLSGVLPDNKKFMDESAFYRVNRMLFQRNTKEIQEEKDDAMAFFNEQFGLDFSQDGVPIKDSKGGLSIPNLATLHPYAISPSLKTRRTTAVSGNHPIEINEKVHEAGWIVAITAKRGAELFGDFGGEKGIPVKPGTTMKYGNWHFKNANYEGQDGIIHFESSEASAPTGRSGHVLYNYAVHDLSCIDGIHNKHGAWGHAVSVVSQRKLLGDRKELGELYGHLAARVQTTINITSV